MRIALDYTAGIRQPAGIGQYARGLVQTMFKLDTQNEYMMITSGRATNEHPFPTASNVRGRNLYISDRYLNILWYRWRIPVYANIFTGSADIYHGLDFVLPPLLGKVRKIVTVHDLAFLQHPETAVPSLAAYLNKVVPESVALADVVAANSYATRQALIEHYKTPPEKITVIPCGIPSYFKRITDPVILEATRHKFELTHPFILSVGTLEPRKNHLGLIKAFHEVQQGNLSQTQLVIAGGKGWLYEETLHVIEELKLEDKVRFLGRVSDLELITLYSMADVFAFPSFFEGFGIPPLEAMACGAPVITSNTSSLPEVTGDAAIQVDPHDIPALAEAISRLLGDEQLRDDLRQKGYKQVKKYAWPRIARKMLSTYQKLHDGATDFSEAVEVNSMSSIQS
jgi:glycosyltransferase involved in cell wall biosynthesis